MHIKTFTYGEIPIELWEIPAIATLLIVVFVYFRFKKKSNLPLYPEYKYFMWGLWAKIIGGLAFAGIYIFHYGQADTTSYFECSLAFAKLFSHNFGDFIEAYFGGGTQEIKSIFTNDTGSPMWYMFSDNKTRMIIKMIVPLLIIGGKSYFVTTVLISVITYGGLWSLYRMFVSHYPHLSKGLAVGILFMPSVTFWGSGMLKDSFTLAATCYFIVATNDIVYKKGPVLRRWIILVLSGFIILSVKPYILIILLPGTLVWYFHSKIKSIKNKYFRYVVVPFIYSFVILTSFAILTGLSDSLGKFAPDKALNTALIIQQDLQQEYYEGNSFDIGTFEATPTSVLSKAPKAIEAGLFRPYLWESKNVVMILSGIENLVILGITTAAVILRMLVFFKRKQKRNANESPLILYGLTFSIIFAYMIGLTTSNFGALVRFKIPLIPLYMGCLIVLIGQVKINSTPRKILLMGKP